MPNALKFKHTDVGRQNGEQARIKVVQGPDYGAVYVILGTNATIGRGEENDIVISDLKASRIHSEMVITPQGWIIKDKGSSNGILYNGTRVRDAKLKIGDTFTVGETTLEFTTSDIGTQMLLAPPRTMEQIQKKLPGYGALSGALGIKSPSEGASGSQNNKRVLLIGGVVVLGFLLFMGEEKPRPPPKKKKENSKAEDLASFLPQGEKNKTAETLFKDGFREYLAGNYNRARTQFETVLQVVPGHPMATLYLENCNKSVENAVKHHLEKGKKAFQTGKLREARAHFERIQRYLFRDQTNPAFIEAKDQLEKVVKAISEGDR